MDVVESGPSVDAADDINCITAGRLIVNVRGASGAIRRARLRPP